jgi:DNA-binding NtrC family response regulator
VPKNYGIERKRGRPKKRKKGVYYSLRRHLKNCQEKPEFNEFFDLRAKLRQLETQMILAALAMAYGKKSYAARLLNIQRTTLVEKMRKLGMPLEKPRKKITT